MDNIITFYKTVTVDYKSEDILQAIQQITFVNHLLYCLYHRIDIVFQSW